MIQEILAQKTVLVVISMEKINLHDFSQYSFNISEEMGYIHAINQQTESLK